MTLDDTVPTVPLTCSFAIKNGIESQLAEVSALLKSAEPALSEHFSRLFRSYFSEPIPDLSYGQCVSTTAADGTRELVCTLRLGDSFERIVAALRAGDFDV